MAIAHAIRFAILQDRPLPIRHGEGLAACGNGHRVALRVERVGIQVAGRVREFAIALRAGAGQGNFDAPGLVSGWIEQIEIAARVVHNAHTIAIEIAYIEIVVRGVAAQIFAGWRTGIDIADALVVGNKIDALTNPAGRGQIAIQVKEWTKLAIARDIAPEPTSFCRPCSVSSVLARRCCVQ